MSEPLLRKAAVLQANLRMLESQADILSDFNDMQALRRYRAEAGEFIAAHAAAGRLPANPLAVIAGRLTRIGQFFAAAGKETDRLLGWKRTWLKKIPKVSLPELHDAAMETAQAVHDLPSSAADLAAMLDDVDWHTSGESADLHPELLVCAASSGMADLPNQATRRQALRGYAGRTGEVSQNVSNHLGKVSRRIEELVALHASHQAMVAAGEAQLTQQNFRSATTILENIGKEKFADIDYSELENGLKQQLALFDRFVDLAASIGESLAKGQLKTVNREMGEVRGLTGNPASEFGHETSPLLNDADAQMASFLRGRKKKRLIAMVVLVVGLVGAVSLALAQIVAKAKADNEVAEAKAKLPAEIGAGRVGATLGVPLAEKAVMPFAFCPSGAFTMGSPASEEGRSGDERQVSVTLSKGFWMAKTEVTQAQWQAVMGNNPSSFKGDDLPVENVSWDDAQEFIKKVNGSGVMPSGWKFALPTEAQWEYACRAGETGPYSGGSIEQVAWYDGNSASQTHDVGTKKANAWGFHDMHGNVWEWCADPSGPASGFSGGSWINVAAYCRAANRLRYGPGYRNESLGFRPALVPSK